MTSIKKNKLYIDLGVFRANVAELMRLNGNNFFCPMVKADAYGHGDIKLAQVLLPLGVKYLGVATLAEAIRLRQGIGHNCKILVFEVFDSAQISQYIVHGLTPVVSAFEQLNIIEKAHLNSVMDIHLKFDIGMSRLGFSIDVAKKVLAATKNLTKKIRIDGVCAHLSNAEEQDLIHKKQIDAFKLIYKTFDQQTTNFHLWNSAGLIAKSADNKVNNYPWGSRPGLSMYGIWPKFDKKKRTQLSKVVNINPIGKFSSQIVAIHHLKKGDSVSYSATWKAKKNTTVATLAAGYADGVPVSLSNKGHVIIANKPAKICGRVCMDYTIVELPKDSDAALFNEAIFFESGRDARLKISDMSRIAGTIPYEIAVRCGSRVERVYNG